MSKHFSSILSLALLTALFSACQDSSDQDRSLQANEQQQQFYAYLQQFAAVNTIKIYDIPPSDLTPEEKNHWQGVFSSRTLELSEHIERLQESGADWERIEAEAVLPALEAASADHAYARHYFEQDVIFKMLDDVLLPLPASAQTAASVKRYADRLADEFDNKEVNLYARSLAYIAPYYKGDVLQEMAQKGLKSITLDRERVRPQPVDPENVGKQRLESSKALLQLVADVRSAK